MQNIKSILLVDDDRDDQYFFYRALEEVAPSVHLSGAGNGEEGFEKIGESEPDLILLDLVMPVMNGHQFLQKIKSDKKLRHIPVIVYTSDLGVNTERELLNLGAEDVIIKPLDFKGTVELINDLLETRNLPRSA